jgi:selenocysteine-specific elongation factor
VVLDVAPRRHRRFNDETLSQLAVREDGDPEALFRQRLSAAGTQGIPRTEAAEWLDHAAAILVGERLYGRDVLAAEASAIKTLIAGYAERFPLRLGIGKEEVRRRRGFAGGAAEWNALCQALAPLGGWVVAGGRIAATVEGPTLPPDLAAAVQRRERTVAGYRLQWPGLAAFAEQVAAGETATAAARGAETSPWPKPEEFLRHLVDRGRAVQIASDYYVHRESFAELKSRLREHFEREPELSFAGFRELSGLTRKLGIPLLEYLDQTGVTSRTGDVRVAGSRLDETAAP